MDFAGDFSPFSFEDGVPAQVRIPLKMHIGAPCEPVVAVGQAVRCGDMIAKLPEGKLGADIHASIDGVVTAVDGRGIAIGFKASISPTTSRTPARRAPSSWR